jgi:exonuclease SbcC
MVKSLQIKNFQSHENTELEFVPGVNVIIGPTDSGKTAVLRALELLIDNRPLGNEFNSNWGGRTVVRLTTTEEITITRAQAEDGTDKTYKLSTIESPMKAFGSDVPKEIKEALNFDEINFQAQLDAPFLLTKTPGDVAKHFNKIAHLEKIDIANTNIKKEINQINSDIKHKQTDLKSKTAELETYQYLETLEKEIQAIEILDEQQIQNKRGFKELEKIYYDVSSLDNTFEEYQQIIEIESILTNVLNAFEKQREVKLQFETLGELTGEIIEINEQLSEFEKVVKISDYINDVLTLV